MSFLSRNGLQPSGPSTPYTDFGASGHYERCISNMLSSWKVSPDSRSPLEALPLSAIVLHISRMSKSPLHGKSMSQRFNLASSDNIVIFEALQYPKKDTWPAALHHRSPYSVWQVMQQTLIGLTSHNQMPENVK